MRREAPRRRRHSWCRWWHGGSGGRDRRWQRSPSDPGKSSRRWFDPKGTKRDRRTNCETCRIHAPSENESFWEIGRLFDLEVDRQIEPNVKPFSLHLKIHNVELWIGVPVVEVGIELVNDWLESEDAKKSGGKRQNGRHRQNRDLQQWILKRWNDGNN